MLCAVFQQINNIFHSPLLHDSGDFPTFYPKTFSLHFCHQVATRFGIPVGLYGPVLILDYLLLLLETHFAIPRRWWEGFPSFFKEWLIQLSFSFQMYWLKVATFLFLFLKLFCGHSVMPQMCFQLVWCIIQIYSGITCGRMLNGELYTQRLQALIYLYLSTGCFMKIDFPPLFRTLVDDFSTIE